MKKVAKVVVGLILVPMVSLALFGCAKRCAEPCREPCREYQMKKECYTK